MGNTTRRVHMAAARSDKGSPRSRSLGRIRGVASLSRLPMAASAPECFPSPAHNEIQAFGGAGAGGGGDVCEGGGG
jgi:hypothetical protein